MAAPEKRKLALDTNVLFDLAANKDFAHTFREAFQEKGYVLNVAPTVIQELSNAAFTWTGDRQHLAEQAHRALSCMRREWNIVPFDLIPVGHGITKQFARLLHTRGLLPDEEINDGLILAEVALSETPAIATYDGHMLDILPRYLEEAFKDFDLMPVLPMHPARLLKTIGH